MRGSLPGWLSAVIATVLGLMMPLQSRVNGQLALETGSAPTAAFFSFGGGLLVLLVATAAWPTLRRSLRRIPPALRGGELPWWYLLAGMLGATLVLTQSVVVAIAGVSIFTVSVVAGQTIGGTVVDALGFGRHTRRLPTLSRTVGGLVLVMAVLIAAAPGGAVATASVIGPALMGAGVGMLSAFQQAMNGRITAVSGTAMAATVINFLTGTLLLALAVTAIALSHDLPTRLPTQWWLYTGGLFGIVFIAGAAILVGHVGVLALTTGSVTGQILGSLLLDAVAPIGTAHTSWWTAVGALLALVAVMVVSRGTPRQRPAREPASREPTG